MRVQRNPLELFYGFSLIFWYFLRTFLIYQLQSDFIVNYYESQFLIRPNDAKQKFCSGQIQRLA